MQKYSVRPMPNAAVEPESPVDGVPRSSNGKSFSISTRALPKASMPLALSWA